VTGPRRALLLGAALLCLCGASAQARKRSPGGGGGAEGAPTTPQASRVGLLAPDTELVDAPTAAVQDQSGFSSRTRFFARGGVLEWLSFGVFPGINLGASLHVDSLIGTDSPVRLTRPDLQVRWRFYDGDRRIPAFAVGFDGQGYFYNRTDKRYNQRQRGLYVVGTQEVGLPGLQAHAGMNISDFDSNSIFGSLGTSLNIRDKVKIMLEWDSINNFYDSRINTGLRIYLTPYFSMDFAVRGVGQGGFFSNGVPRDPERVVQFKYCGTF